MDVYRREALINSMPKDERFLQSLVQRVGVLRADQLIELSKANNISDDSCFHYLNHLVSKGDRIQVTEDNFIEDMGVAKPNYHAYECMWDVIHSKDSVDLKTLEKAEYPADIMYCTKDNRVYIDTFVDEKSMGKIVFLQERFYERQTKNHKGEYDHKDYLWHIFVVNSMEMAIAISENIEIIMPYRICLISYKTNDHSDIPEIKYFASEN